MRRCLLILCAVLGLAACATKPRLPSCDGRHLRPANPHGSVLLSADPPKELDLSYAPCGVRT